MDLSLIQIFATILMIGLTAALCFAFRRYLEKNSERRLRAMLSYVGLHPSLPWVHDAETVMRKIRQRCRSCQSEDVCERWLRDGRRGSNDFCPNAKVFEKLAR